MLAEAEEQLALLRYVDYCQKHHEEEGAWPELRANWTPTILREFAIWCWLFHRGSDSEVKDQVIKAVEERLVNAMRNATTPYSSPVAPGVLPSP